MLQQCNTNQEVYNKEISCNQSCTHNTEILLNKREPDFSVLLLAKTLYSSVYSVITAVNDNLPVIFKILIHKMFQVFIYAFIYYFIFIFSFGLYAPGITVKWKAFWRQNKNWNNTIMILSFAKPQMRHLGMEKCFEGTLNRPRTNCYRKWHPLLNIH